MSRPEPCRIEGTIILVIDLPGCPRRHVHAKTGTEFNANTYQMDW